MNSYLNDPEHIVNRRKIPAIKRHRQITDSSLQESKSVIDKLFEIDLETFNEIMWTVNTTLLSNILQRFGPEMTSAEKNAVKGAMRKPIFILTTPQA
jgi:tRNA nucleotidyltransferase (CCA-adding enzyme)